MYIDFRAMSFSSSSYFRYIAKELRIIICYKVMNRKGSCLVICLHSVKRQQQQEQKTIRNEGKLIAHLLLKA